MKQPIVGFNSQLSQIATEYNGLMGGTLWTATEALAYQCMPTAGTLGGLFIELSANVAAASTFVFKVVVDGTPSEVLKVTISAGQKTGSCLDTIDVVAGQTVSLESSYTGTPGTPTARWTTQFIGTTAGESICLVNSGSHTATTYYGAIQGRDYNVSTENQVQAPIPTAGRFKKLYVQLSEDPGTSPDAYTIALRVGGASVNNTVTIVANNTSGNSGAATDVVAAGDLVDFIITPVSTPSVAPKVAIGIVFVSDVDGESLIIGGASLGTPSLTSTEYYLLCGGYNDWNAISSTRLSLIQACTIKNLYVVLSAAPGAGDPVKSYTISINKDASVASGLTVTISTLATSGSDLVNTYNPADGDTAAIKSVPANTPAATYIHIGLVAYIPPLVTIQVGNIATKMLAAGMI